MNSVLGQMWHLLNPALMILVYYFIFGVFLGARDGIDNYVAFLVAGVISFRYVQAVIIQCTRSVPANIGLIRSVQFPRALVPGAVTIEQTLALLPGLLLVFVVAAVDGAPITWRILLLPAVIGAGASFALGLGFFGARIGASLTDLSQVLPHAFRILLYTSGVLFSLQRSVSNQLILTIFQLNPFYGFVSTVRWSIMAQPLEPLVVGSFLCWALIAPVVGLWYFRRAEHQFGA